MGLRDVHLAEQPLEPSQVARHIHLMEELRGLIGILPVDQLHELPEVLLDSAGCKRSGTFQIHSPMRELPPKGPPKGFDAQERGFDLFPIGHHILRLSGLKKRLDFLHGGLLGLHGARLAPFSGELAQGGRLGRVAWLHCSDNVGSDSDASSYGDSAHEPNDLRNHFDQ